MTTNQQQAAQKIADKIDTHSHEEIMAMIEIVSELIEIKGSLLATVGNLYAKKNPSVRFSGIKVG